MSSAYRTDLIPRWIWVMLVVAGTLLLLVALSMAGVRNNGAAVLGNVVPTGNPADYLKQPPVVTPPVEITPTTPPTTVPPSMTPAPSIPTTPPNVTTTTPTPTPPQGFPQSFVYNKQTWNFAGGPIQLQVETTGDYTGDNTIYHKQGKVPPYDVLYLESSANSGMFYKYVPGKP